MDGTVWLQMDDTEHGPDGRAWHVEVGSEVHKRLLAEGAHQVPGPDDEPDPVGDGLDDLKLDELRELAEQAELDVSSNAKQPYIDALRERDAGGEELA